MNELINIEFERKLAILFSEYKAGIRCITHEHSAEYLYGRFGKIIIDVTYNPDMKPLTDADFAEKPTPPELRVIKEGKSRAEKPKKGEKP